MPRPQARQPPRFYGDVRPNPCLGAFYWIPPGHSGHRTGPDLSMAVGYLFPPSTHCDPDTPDSWRIPYPLYAPGEIIGPVIGVDHSKLSMAVLIANHWIVVWSAYAVWQQGFLSHYQGLHHYYPDLPQCKARRDIWLSDNLGVPFRDPFHDLWPLAEYLGLSHIYLSTDHHIPALPRFLISGDAWVRLYGVREFLHDCTDREGAIANEDLLLGLHRLYYFLDYPATAYTPGGQSDTPAIPNLLQIAAGSIRPHVPSPALAKIKATDRQARGRLCRWFRKWVRTRRERRKLAWATLLHITRLLTGAVPALPHVLEVIGASL